MKLIEPSVEILTDIPNNVLQSIEQCGRVCYKSEARMTDVGNKAFVAGLIKNGHESVLEHYSFTVKFITDRGISHEIVRHRLASYSQESTRYCNYKEKEIEFLSPFEKNPAMFTHTLEMAELAYKKLIANGATPQTARAVLPTALKTEVIMTANLREWRHFLKLRCHSTAHPQMRQVAIPLLRYLKKRIPIVFDSIYESEPEGLRLAKLVEKKFI